MPSGRCVTMTEVSPQSSAAPPLKIVFVGHVDHGKSTLIGRILHDTGSLPEGKIEEIKKACAAEGMEFEFAFLLDALLEEQKQNVTIDTTEIPFRTARRRYAIIDAPGHKEFLKNMITGASRADAAMLVIGADEGVREQSRRHAYLLSMLGVNQVIVVVNKMDLIDYSEKRFREIEQDYRKFLQQLGLNALTFIPASAKQGENVARAGMKMKWYRAANVLEALDLLEPQKRDVDLPLRFCVQDVYRFDGRRIIAGRIETGKLDLAFTNQNLNELVESCVAVLQPQANRERIIIRTSLAHMLPPVIADARALRQIALNLIGNSIHLANAGGQVIVSTALSDFGDVMLRVRDTGHGLNDNEVAAALQPFRTPAPSDRAESSAVSLSLTKALVEANRAKFQIKTGGRSGTLIEIVFPHAVARV